MSTVAVASLARKPADGVAFDGPRWNGWIVAAIFVGALILARVVSAGLFLLIMAVSNLHVPLGQLIQAFHHVSRDSQLYAVFHMPAVSDFLALVGAVVLVGVVYFSRRALGLTPDKLGLRRPASGQVGLALFTGGVLIVVSVIGAVVVRGLLGRHVSPGSAGLSSHHGFGLFVLEFATLVVLGPFSGELLNRGLLFGALVQRVPVWLAVAASAAVFAALHLSLYGFVAHFAVGIRLALAYYRSRNLWVAVIAHGMINAFVLISTYLMIGSRWG